MKKVLGLVGVAAACAACCAIPLALPLLGGMAASGLGFAFGWEVAALLAAATLVLLVVLARRRQARTAACAPGAKSTGCDCADSCVTGKGNASF